MFLFLCLILVKDFFMSIYNYQKHGKYFENIEDALEKWNGIRSRIPDVKIKKS